jgi:chromosome segregation ATPase
LLDRTHLRFFARPDLQDMLLATGYLPAVWERNLAPETTTELTYYWQQLAPAVQQSLQQNIDGQTYQFIVKAYVSDEAGWLASTRIQAEHAVHERDRLERELTEARVKLNEYAKAYQEASARLPELEKSRHEYAEAFQQARDKLFEHEETLKNQSQVIGESRTKIEQLTNEQQTLQQLLYEAKLSLKYWFIQGLRRLKYLKR